MSPRCCKALTDGSNGRATPVVERKASLEEREGQARVEDEEGRDVEGQQVPREEEGEEEEQDKGVEDQAPLLANSTSSSAAADAAPQVSPLMYGISHQCMLLRLFLRVLIEVSMVCWLIVPSIGGGPRLACRVSDGPPVTAHRPAAAARHELGLPGHLLAI